MAPESEQEIEATEAETTPAPEFGRKPAPLIGRVARLAERVSRAPARPQISAISQAVDEVMQIIEALKRTVEQMEDVLELVELAERQKLADERELDSLRRALRQLQRPHDAGRRERHEPH